jgi:Complex I intermediate-associated protein 30 (CIA30)
MHGPPHDRVFTLDDRRTGTTVSTLGPAWRFFSDGAMGGVSSGSMSVGTVEGRPALCLRGQVRLDNRGGFIQMALELPALPEGGPWRGIEIDVRGNGHRYGLHLRTRVMTAPWQAWRASFEAGSTWQTVRLPFDAFEPYRTSGALEPATIRRIGVVAIGERFEAEVCVARLAIYR